MKWLSVIFLVIGVAVGIVSTLLVQQFFLTNPSEQLSSQDDKYSFVMSAESRRAGTPVMVRMELLVEKGSELETQLLQGTDQPELYMLLDAPTDVVTLYLEKLRLGTLTEDERTMFNDSVLNYTTSVNQ